MPTYPISRYLNCRMAYAPTVSANGDKVAFLTNITGSNQVWQVPLTDSPHMAWPDQLTFGSNRVVGVQYSPTNNNHLLFGRDAKGNENIQLFLLEVDTGIVTPLTAGYENAMHLAGKWTPDGQAIVFAGNRRHKGLFDLYWQNLGEESHLIWQQEEPGYIFYVTFSPDGKYLIAQRSINSKQSELYEIEVSSGEYRRLTPEVLACFDTPVYLSNEEIIISTDYESDFFYIGKLNLTTKQIEPFIQKDWDVELPTLSSDKKTLLYHVNENGNSLIYAQDLVTSTIKSSQTVNEQLGIIISAFGPSLCFDSAGNQVFYPFSANNHPPDIYLWDLNQHTEHALTQSSTGGIPTKSFTGPQLIHYPTFDGREIPAWWYLPSQVADRVPVVVMVHGGPESQFQTHFNFLVQYFVHHGYAVLAPNVRGSTGYGKIYARLDDVEKRMDSVEDLGYAARWLKQQPIVDASKLIVYGGSYGGFMVLATLTAHPDLWAAGIDIVGISNLVTFLENTSDYRRTHRESEYGSLEHERAFLEEISPLNHIDNLKAPLFIIHGANDPRVPLSEAKQLADILQKRQHPVELLVFDDEGHGITKLKNKLIMYPAIVNFLQKYVL